MMHVRLTDRKVKAAVRAEAKARGCSCARAVEVSLSEYFFGRRSRAKAFIAAATR